MSKIAIVGGGAAGMMVAATLLEEPDFNGEIHLFEKNSRLGAKVIISGGGRCNITTGYYKKQELLGHYPRGAAFLEPALNAFGPKKIFRWFEDHGVKLKKEEDMRIFPVSDDGKEVVGVFEKLFASHAVHLHLKEGIEQISLQDKKFIVKSTKQAYEFDIVVLTTGGNAYAHTGSSGDGYAFARACGHTITPLGPSLNSFLTAETTRHELSGNVFPDAIIHGGGHHVQGPVLLTHFGISGPATFAFSSHIPYETVSAEHPFQIHLQPLASMNQHQRFEFRRVNHQSSKEIGTLLGEFFTKRIVQTLLSTLHLDPHLKPAALSKPQLHALSELLGQGIPLTLLQRRPGDEFVTAGGVALDEVDPETGQSRLVPGLYFAGEILDIDGHTGGYNLTSSWAIGRIVGEKIAKS